MIKKYIETVPYKIEAIQWKGDNFKEVDEFCSVKYGKNKVYHYAELWDEPHSRPGVLSEKVREKWNKPRIILKGDMWCGDEAFYLDYIVRGDEFYHVAPEAFEEKYQKTDQPNVYESKEQKVVEAIQWLDNNTEEVLAFLGKDGGLEQSKTQILIMNNSGGSVLNKTDYLLKVNDEYFTCLKKIFEISFKEI